MISNSIISHNFITCRCYESSIKKIHIIINPLTPGGHRCPLSPKFQFFFKNGSSKKFPMSVVAPMIRYTKITYLRLCPEKQRKKEFGPKRVKVYIINETSCSLCLNFVTLFIRLIINSKYVTKMNNIVCKYEYTQLNNIFFSLYIRIIHHYTAQ